MIRKSPIFLQLLDESLAEILGEIEAIRKTTGMATVASLTPLSVFRVEETGFTKKDLSDYPGISIRSLNRLLKELENKNKKK
jgi:CRP-like cAMP-binding protein